MQADEVENCHWSRIVELNAAVFRAAKLRNWQQLHELNAVRDLRIRNFFARYLSDTEQAMHRITMLIVDNRKLVAIIQRARQQLDQETKSLQKVKRAQQFYLTNTDKSN